MGKTYDIPESRFSWSGWYEGEGDCEPPEPGKQWLTIHDQDEEFCVIVLRRDLSSKSSEAYSAKESELMERATFLVEALNTHNAKLLDAGRL